MSRRRFRPPSPAVVIAMVALFAALGGTSFAATKVIASTHTDKKADTKLIKKLAPSLSVKHAKTANSATNATNATNATHATSANSATNATNATNASELGGVGAGGYQRSTLPPGKTETGVFSAWGQGNTSGGYLADGVTFPIPLAADLSESNWVFLPFGTSSGTHCPGVGHADPGYLCFYEVNTGNTALVNVFDPTTGNNGISKIGFDMYYTFLGAGAAWSYGEWAVTAPTTALTKNAAHAPSRHLNP